MTVQSLIITENAQNNTNGALNQNGCDFIAFIVMELVGLENRYEGLWLMGAFIDTSQGGI